MFSSRDIEESHKEPLLEAPSNAQYSDDNFQNRRCNKIYQLAKKGFLVGAVISVLFMILSYHQNQPLEIVLQDFQNSKGSSASEVFSIVRADHTNNESLSELEKPIPPIHPKHYAVISYSSAMDPSAKVQYRRDITVPCDHGMLVFSVGLAKDEMPYTYEVYNDAYLHSDNNGLCILRPMYTGYQVGDHPFWAPTDPQQVTIQNLDIHNMHWISSRVANPFRSHKSYDKKVVGDHIVVAKGDFYDAHYYQALKETVNSWK